jgi:hypothetical protein
MPYSYAVYNGNGSTTQFNVSFPYIRREHVVASIDYVSASFTWINNTTIEISPAPGNGTRVEVRRVTPVNVPLVDFADGSTLVAADLDTNALQQTYINQEQDDQFQDAVFVNAQGLLDAGAKRLTNLSDPANAQDAATKAYVDNSIVGATLPDNNYGDITLTGNATVWTINNGAITNAKVASNAAIAGTKIAPNFGSQNIVTSGTANLAGLAYPTADGTADQSLVTNGSGTLSFASRSRLVRESAAPASGLSVTFASIPSWVRKLTIILSGVSTNGTANILLRLSTGGVFATTTYVSNMQVVQGGSTTNAANSTAGFIISQGAATVVTTCTYEFINNDGNEWVGRSVVAYEHAVVGAFGGGRLTLGGTLDGIRILTANGTDTFDAGSVNIIYEG